MQRPTCTNVRIRSTQDAHKIFFAVQQGLLRMVTRRLDADERLALTTGCVYAWEERGPHTEITGLGIERFTEGRRWSPSRVRDEFLFYYEKYTGTPDINQLGAPLEKQPPRDWDPLVKQTYSVWVETENGRRKWHLTAYFTQTTVDDLGTIDDLPGIRELATPAGLFTSTRVGKNRGRTDDQQSNGTSPKPSTAVAQTYVPFSTLHNRYPSQSESPPASESIRMYEPYDYGYPHPSSSPRYPHSAPTPQHLSPNTGPSQSSHHSPYSSTLLTTPLHPANHMDSLRPISSTQPRGVSSSTPSVPPSFTAASIPRGPLSDRPYTASLTLPRPPPPPTSWNDAPANIDRLYTATEAPPSIPPRPVQPPSFPHPPIDTPDRFDRRLPLPGPDVLSGIADGAFRAAPSHISDLSQSPSPHAIPSRELPPIDSLALRDVSEGRRGSIGPDRDLASLYSVPRVHPYRRDPLDDTTLRLLTPRSS